MSHGGNPEAGTNPFIGNDGTGLTISSPNGPDSWVIPVSDTFTVSMTWELTGVFALWLAASGSPTRLRTRSPGSVTPTARRSPWPDHRSTANHLRAPGNDRDSARRVTAGRHVRGPGDGDVRRQPPDVRLHQIPVLDIYQG